jgi:hypothetical protein
MIEDLKVRERAYQLWEKDGRPQGSEEFYWRLAQEQLEGEAPPEPVPTEWETSLDQASAPEDIEKNTDSEWPAKGEASRFDR